jgi:HEAT repeat protein
VRSLLYSRYWPLVEKAVPLAVFVLYVAAVLVVGKHLTPDNLYARYALACVLVQSSTLMLVTAGLFAGKAIALRLGARRQRRMDRIAEQMVRYALSSETEAALLENADRYPAEFLKVWEGSLTTVRGPARERVVNLLSKTGLDQRLRSRVAGADPGRAVWAISLLRELNEPSSLRVIEEALAHPAETVRASACIALAAHGSETQQDKVFALLPALPFWQRIVLFQQVRADSPALDKYLSHAFRSADHTVVLAALEFVLSRQRMQPVGSAAGMASASDVEVRIKFFKALPFLATAEDPASLVETGLQDPDWRVRAMAARACGALRLAPLTAILVERLAASEQAAEVGHLARALASFGGESLLRLRAFTTSNNDLTRSVTAEVLEKAMLAPGGLR